MATLGDAMIAFAIVAGFLGFFYLLFSLADSSLSDYEVCIRKCPTDRQGNFAGLDCPKMCESLSVDRENCTKEGITKKYGGNK